MAVLLGFCGSASAQEILADTATVEPQRLLIVPFEDKLFFSDVMPELAEGSGIAPNEVVNALRNSLQLSVQQILKDSIEVGTFLSADSIPPEGLVRIFGSLGYDYVALYGEQRQTKQRSGIERGQVNASRDTTTRYMAAAMKDDAVLRDLQGSHGFNRFLFLTQLEVRMDLSDPEQAMLLGKRTVAVHYTLTGAGGSPLNGGVARYDMQGGTDFGRIRAEAFPAIAKQILIAFLSKEQGRKSKK